MDRLTKRFSLLVLLATAAFAAQARSAPAATLPYGHADFVPTPERPIGFCGDGNSYFPGANPPVEWWDGTPGWAKIRHRGGMGNCSPPFDDSTAEAEMRVLLDRVPKNILWKVPAPGWGDSQPIVVGKRVINCYWPHIVVCFDALTGNELWRDELELCLLAQLQVDRRTIGPAPDAKEARGLQTLFELGHAMKHLSFTLRDFEGKDPGTAELPLVKQAIERMGEWRKTLQAAYPAGAPELDYDIAVARRFVAGEYGVLGFGQEKLDEQRERMKAIPQFGMDRSKGLVTFAERTCKTVLNNAWGSWCPFQASTPTSDGEIVVVRFAHGQVGAYEVATGKRLWAWRDLKVSCPWTYHIPSPRIGREVVVLDALFGRSRDAVGPALLGIDKRTGAIRWHLPETPNSGYPSSTPLLIDLDDGKGGVLPVVVGIAGDVVRQSDGKVLCKLECKDTSEGYVLHRANLVFTIISDDGRLARRAYRLGVVSPDEVKAQAVRDFAEISAHRAPTAMSDTFLFGRSNFGLDLTTLKVVPYSTPMAVGTAEARGVSIAGQYHIFPSHNFFDEKYRPRRDGMCLETFHVTEVPRHPGDSPTFLSDRSLLGGAEAPADLFFDRYLAGFDKMRQINPKKWCGRYGTHLGAFFGLRLGGPVPQGERLYIQGQCFLYCIGPAVKGTPGDDPKVVATIRGEGDAAKLAPYLDHASAQYRYEAVKRIGAMKPTLPIPVAQKAAKLLVDDPYEEIRAAAVLALDACDPQGKAGWAALVAGEFAPCYGEEIHFGRPGHRDQQERRKRLPLLFRAMGDEGKAMMAARWPEAAVDATQRRALLEAATALGWRVDPMFKSAMEWCHKPAARGNDPGLRGLPAYFAAIDAASDTAAAQVLAKAYPTDWNLFATFDRHLASDQKLAWLETAVPANIGARKAVILQAWERMGAGAIPSMRRVAAKLSADSKNGAAIEHSKSVTAAIDTMEREAPR